MDSIEDIDQSSALLRDGLQRITVGVTRTDSSRRRLEKSPSRGSYSTRLPFDSEKES